MRAGLCGEVRLDDLACRCGCCVRKQGRGGGQVQLYGFLAFHTPGASKSSASTSSSTFFASLRRTREQMGVFTKTRWHGW